MFFGMFIGYVKINWFVGYYLLVFYLICSYILYENLGYCEG